MGLPPLTGQHQLVSWKWLPLVSVEALPQGQKGLKIMEALPTCAVISGKPTVPESLAGSPRALWELTSCPPCMVCALMAAQPGMPTFWMTCPSSQSPVCPEPFVQTVASWFLVTGLPQANWKARHINVSHLWGKQRSPFLCGHRTSAPGR